MGPDHLVNRLLHVAQRLDSSVKPSVARVSAELRSILAELEAPKDGSERPSIRTESRVSR